MLININNPKYLSYELHQCALPSWYSKFEKITIPTRFIQIPNNILQYLKDEIIVLPKECYTNLNTSDSVIFNTISNISQQQQISDDNNSSDDDDDNELIIPEFPEFSNKIKEIIDNLSGSVFIKTNWHSPKDAFWITAGQTLKVQDITDTYQLLKASNFVKKDLNNHDLPLLENLSEQSINNSDYDDNQPPFYLILKQWLDIHPGTEFRCFVYKRNLIAISPRDWPQYHKYIIQQSSEIISDILSIFKEKIQNEFPLENFCFDVIRVIKDNVIIVDFSPFNEKFTDPLAFDWNYLLNYHQNLEDNNGDDNIYPEFRYINTDCGIQPSKRNNYGFPQDIIDVFNNTTSDYLTDLLSTTQLQNL